MTIKTTAMGHLISLTGAVSVFCALSAGIARADQYPLTPESGVFAIVTGKEGLASGLAHRHIIVARQIQGTLTIEQAGGSDQALVKSGAAQIEFRVEDLAVDKLEEAQRIIPLLEAHKSWDSKVDELSPSNSDTVRENMLDSNQLNHTKFPTIKGVATFGDCKAAAADAATCSMDLQLMIKGATVARKTNLTVSKSAGGLSGTFHLPLKFTDFGIKPYSAMMGAIKVKDDMIIAGQIRIQPAGRAK